MAEEYAGYPDLHRAAATGNVAAIERLRDGGADPDARDVDGRTPLHIAALTGNSDAASALVRCGADPQAYDQEHVDALTIAATRGDHAMVALLLWLGADPKAVTGRDDRTALIAAAGAPVNWMSSLGWTALMEAVIFGDDPARTAATVQALLEGGAKARFRDWQGTSALRIARLKGDEAAAALLIAAGAD